MLLMKRRQIVIVALSLMIVVAAYLNWAYTGDFDEVVTTAGIEQDNEAKRFGEAQFVNAGDDSVETDAEARGTAPAASASPAVSASPQASASPSAGQKATGGNTYFTEARMNRDRARDTSLDVLREIVENKNSSKEEVASAQQKMQAMADATENESSIENLIRAKGFNDVLAFISEDKVDITVASSGLSPSDAAKIKDIVLSRVQTSADKIRIIEIK